MSNNEIGVLARNFKASDLLKMVCAVESDFAKSELAIAYTISRMSKEEIVGIYDMVEETDNE